MIIPATSINKAININYNFSDICFFILGLSFIFTVAILSISLIAMGIDFLNKKEK